MNTPGSDEWRTTRAKWIWPIIMVGMALLIWKNGYAFGQWLFDRFH
ncbi:MAG: hypothetical protein ACO1NQ_04780 [Flavobacteriales bacterium]